MTIMANKICIILILSETAIVSKA